MTIAFAPSRLKATQEPRANPALRSTPSSVTWRSFLGSPKRMTSPGCAWPGRPIAASTSFHSDDCENARLVTRNMPPARTPIFLRRIHSPLLRQTVVQTFDEFHSPLQQLLVCQTQ